MSDLQTPLVELLGHLQQGKYAIKSNARLSFDFRFDRCPCDRFHLSNGVRSLLRHSMLYETCALPKLVGTMYQSVTDSHHPFVLRWTVLFLLRIKHEGVYKSDYPLWPPFRLPAHDHQQMSQVQRILRSSVLHQFLFLCLNGLRLLETPEVHRFLIRFSISKTNRSARTFFTWLSISWNWLFVT